MIFLSKKISLELILQFKVDELTHLQNICNPNGYQLEWDECL
tara:strand:- start:975 stop:1100 length:126 start_codon:yes stop_codon:yes gene_type:complete